MPAILFSGRPLLRLQFEFTGGPPSGEAWISIKAQKSGQRIGVTVCCKSPFRRLLKMPRCKAPEILRSEAYMLVRRSDEG